MEFSFTVPVPPSWNAMYRVAWVPIKDKYGQTRVGTDGRSSRRMGLIKTRETAAMQEAISLIVKTARPSGWLPPEEIIVGYRFYLKRIADVDNLEKALGDSIARALGVNDRIFLPIPLAREKSTDPRVEVELYDAAKYVIAVVPR